MQSSPFPLYLVPPRSKYFPQQYTVRHYNRADVNQCTSPDFLICISQRSVTHILYSIHKIIIILNYGHTRYCGVSTFVIGKEMEILCCKLDCSVFTCLTQLYGGRDMYNLLHKEELNVSALFIGHLQVDKRKT